MEQPGIARADGIGLRMAIGAGCSLLLRRRDMRPEPRFGQFFGQPMQAEALARFLPNWKTLDWKEPPRNLLSRPEWVAFDGRFQVNLETQRDSHDQAIGLFARYMQGRAYVSAALTRPGS